MTHDPTPAPERPLIFGHRGAPNAMPENTLEGFAHALDVGADGLELDVFLTRDGIPVVTHNPGLMAEMTRDASGHWLEVDGPVISELTLSELCAFNVGGIRPGSDYGKHFPDQKILPHAAIPTLDAVLRLARDYARRDVRLLVEIKHPPLRSRPEELRRLVDVVAAAVANHDFVDQSFVHAFDWAVLDVACKTWASWPRSYLSKRLGCNGTGTVFPGSPWLGNIAFSDSGQSIPHLIQRASGKAWSPWYDDLNADDLRHAHQLNLQVFCWTVNNVGDLRAVMDLCVDGVVTDDPGFAATLTGDARRSRRREWE